MNFFKHTMEKSDHSNYLFRLIIWGEDNYEIIRFQI